MDKKQIKIMILLYNQVFDDYTTQMMWLCNKQDFSQNKKFVISRDIKEKALIELLRVHEFLKQENGLPNAFDFDPSSKAP